jgi:hypothetical protein
MRRPNRVQRVDSSGVQRSCASSQLGSFRRRTICRFAETWVPGPQDESMCEGPCRERLQSGADAEAVSEQRPFASLGSKGVIWILKIQG